MTSTPMPTSAPLPGEGLRARKKRETRRRISDIATGLFLERGFVTVTVADVAKAADVSVNTVYNYFPTKEDLCLDRDAEQRDRLARAARERRPGESVARAVLRSLREGIERRDPSLGLAEGFDGFLRMMYSSPTLTLRLHTIGHEMAVRLAETIREELGADEEDELPRLVAGQVAWAQAEVYGEIGRRVMAGESVDEIVPALLRRVDAIESLLGERVLAYAVRGEAEGEPEGCGELRG